MNSYFFFFHMYCNKRKLLEIWWHTCICPCKQVLYSRLGRSVFLHNFIFFNSWWNRNQKNTFVNNFEELVQSSVVLLLDKVLSANCGIYSICLCVLWVTEGVVQLNERVSVCVCLLAHWEGRGYSPLPNLMGFSFLSTANKITELLWVPFSDFSLHCFPPPAPPYMPVARSEAK